jgi:serine/threonine protein kinase
VISSPLYDAGASAAALDAARTIDDIEGAGFRVLGLLGTGAFGSVYSAEVVHKDGWAEQPPGAFMRSVHRMRQRKINDGLLLPDADHGLLRGLPLPLPLHVARGVRVAVKRMAKGTRLRPVDADDYEGTDVHAASSAAAGEEEEEEEEEEDAPPPPLGRSAADVAFQREVVALRAAGYDGAHHPHIGNLLGTFESDSSHYIVLELVEGLPLFDWIVEHGVFFRESTAAAALRQVVDALAHLHARHICHNDVKPENVLVSRVARAQMGARGGNPDDVEGKLNTVPGRAFGATAPITNEDGGRNGAASAAGGRSGSELTLKVIDFGMSHVLSGQGRRAEEEEGVILGRRRRGGEGEDKDEQDGVIRNGSSRGGLRRTLTNNSSLHSTIEGGPGEGTFAYWAPEMMCGERYGVAVDMWALGVTLYIALCGVHPFDPRGVRCVWRRRRRRRRRGRCRGVVFVVVCGWWFGGGGGGGFFSPFFLFSFFSLFRLLLLLLLLLLSPRMKYLPPFLTKPAILYPDKRRPQQ